MVSLRYLGTSLDFPFCGCKMVEVFEYLRFVTILSVEKKDLLSVNLLASRLFVEVLRSHGSVLSLVRGMALSGITRIHSDKSGPAQTLAESVFLLI